MNNNVVKKLVSKSKINSNNIVSRQRYNREELLSNRTAHELNTYLSFKPFATFNDLYEPKYDANGKPKWSEKEGSLGTPGVRSIFNKAGAVVLGSTDGSMQRDPRKGDSNNTSEWRISNNVPLMDSPEARRRIRNNSGCSVKELVQASSTGILGRETYSYSDFMYCKYLGKVSNNYLITLRRFPLPVDDYTSAIGETSRVDEKIQSQNVESIGCMVTWLGTPGNDINNILSYTVSMPYKEQTAKMNDPQVDADSGGGLLNGIANAMDPTYRQQFMAGEASGATGQYMSKFFHVELGGAAYPVSSWASHQDQNKVYGPVDAIKTTYMRSDDGIKFDQNINLQFDYELRSYNGINGRQAMLDLLANILNVVYTTGTFWGGGYRGGGAHQSNIFANLNIFKVRGGATDFRDAFMKDLNNGMKTFGEKYSPMDLKSLGQAVKNIANQLGGMLIAGKLNKLGRPQKAMVQSLLSPAPVGFWHVTIGNPHHPIMSMGNMILKSAKIEHYGPLGIDDFPTGLRVTCELSRGKPRDIRDIEKLYMHGNDRIYYSMGPKVFDMYNNAQEYKQAIGNSNTEIKTYNNISGYRDTYAEIKEIAKGKKVNTQGMEKVFLETSIDRSKLVNIGDTLQKYFGHRNAYSIYVAAAEQENGSQKKKSKTASGDSSVGGGLKGSLK